MKVLFVQGPPGSGKDAVGKILAAANPLVRLVKFAEILKLRTHALFGALDMTGNALRANYFDTVKDRPNDNFFGLTPRQAYIKVSEEWLKPLAGKQVFGGMLLREMRTYPLAGTIFVVTDSGFAAEAEPIIKHFGIQNCAVLQLMRQGHTFKNDSRSYWGLQYLREQFIVNDGSLDDLRTSLTQHFPELFPSQEYDHDGAICLPPRPESPR